tara:strand:- start:183 stop:386 length:204 start_codon:yes stop_codon:yes gene_type:complete
MELIDTPNPNAKKIVTDEKKDHVSEELHKIEGISSIFFGPGFITISKEENTKWESINQDIINIFDKL